MLVAIASFSALGASDASAACEAPATADQLQALLDQSPGLLRRGQFDALEQNFDATAALVPCLGDLPSEVTFADLHRLLGLARFVDGQDEAAKRHFARARQLNPTARLAPDLVQPGHPAAPLWTTAADVEVQHVAVPAPREGLLYWDGQPGLERAVNLPTVLQVVGGDDEVRSSVLLQPGDPLPAYPTARRGVDRGALLWAGAGVSGLLALGSAVGAVATERRWEALTEARQEGGEARAWEARFERLERENRLCIGLSIGFGALAVGSGTAAVLGYPE